MFSTAELVITLIMGLSFGIGFGLMAAFWKPRRKADYRPPYHVFSGDPQPGQWSPSHAIGNEFKTYNNRAEWARDKGLV